MYAIFIAHVTIETIIPLKKTRLVEYNYICLNKILIMKKVFQRDADFPRLLFEFILL
jgi:hypothetical protein